MLSDVKQPTDLFKAFADTTRVRILNLLAQREHCVCEFQSILRVPQPKISRHLAYLRRSGLVQTRREGKWIYYTLAPATHAVHASLLRYLRGCFTEIDFLQQDLKRARKAKPKNNTCCGTPARWKRLCGTKGRHA